MPFPWSFSEYCYAKMGMSLSKVINHSSSTEISLDIIIIVYFMPVKDTCLTDCQVDQAILLGRGP